MLVRIKLMHQGEKAGQIIVGQRMKNWFIHCAASFVWRNCLRANLSGYNANHHCNIIPRALLVRCATVQEITCLIAGLFLAVCSRLGVSATLFPGVLWAMADEKGKVTRDMIDSAATIADVPIPDEYKDMMLESLNDF